jgi:hypothetical protein
MPRARRWKADFVTIHHRREIEHAPTVIRELLTSKLGIREAAHVSELLEIPTLVASTDSVGTVPPADQT